MPTKPRGIRELQARAAQAPSHIPKRKWTGAEMWERVRNTPPHLKPGEREKP
jgi:hypothetical protein